LQQGKEAGVTFGKPATLARNQPQPGYPPAALAMIFQADATKLPAYAGSINERGGYSVYRIQRVIAPAAPDAARLTAFSDRVGDQMGRELAAAYVASLKSKADVKINQANLEKEGQGAGTTERPVSRRGRKGS
jgi:peptidyl-prolyl cis-trans isomerase D